MVPKTYFGWLDPHVESVFHGIYVILYMHL